MKSIVRSIIFFYLICLSVQSIASNYQNDFRLAKKYFNANKIDSSSLIFDKIIQQSTDPTDRLAAQTGKFQIATYLLKLKAADSLMMLCEDLIESPSISQKHKLKYWQEKGEYYRSNSNFSEALKSHKYVLNQSKKLVQDTLLQGYAYTYVAGTFERIGDYDSAIHYIDLAVHYFENHYDTTSQKLGSIYNMAGSCYYRISDFSKAEYYYNKTVAIYLKHVGKWSYGLSQAYSNLSSIYGDREEYLKAIALSEKALAINEHFNDDGAISASYYSLAVYYYYLGDYGRAKDYCLTSIELRKKVYSNPLHFKHAYPNTVLAIAHEESGNYEEALKYLKITQRINQANFKGPNINTAYDNENIALLYNLKGNTDSAQKYINKATAVLPVKLTTNDLSLAIHYHSVALINFKSENYNKALGGINKSSLIYKNLELDHTAEYAQNLALKAKILLALDQSKEAEQTFNDALAVIQSKTGSNDKLETSMTAPAMEVIQQSVLFNYELFLKNPKEEYLDEIKKYSQLYFELSDKFRKQFNDPYTKSVLVKNNAQTFKLFSGIFYDLYKLTGKDIYKQQLYYTAEYSRTAFFRDLIDDYKVEHFADLPDTLLQKERELKQALTQLNQRSIDDHSDSLRQTTFEIKEEYNKLSTYLLNNHPKYYALKIHADITSIEKVQSKINSNQVVVEYFTDDTAFYALVINNANVHVYPIGNTEHINATIQTWRKQLLRLEQNKLKQSSYQLYQKLWQPLANYLNNKEVIIVPTGTLFYVNFEALQSKDSENSYLIYDNNISYALSLNVLFEQQYTDNKSTNNNMLFIAPIFDDEMKKAYEKQLSEDKSTDIAYLKTLRQPWSKKLGNNLKRKFKSKILTGNEANESNIKEDDLNAAIVHFATHAIGNEDDPLRSKLVLAKDIGDEKNDGYLHAYELYDINLKTELAILNACESGIGKVKDGEGMISLAYAMHYAGCPSTILSLWKIDEKANAAILRTFYDNIAKDMTKNEALRQAKLTYISHATKLMQHPYYWSGLILMGENDTLDLNKKEFYQHFFIFAIGTLLLLAIVIFLRKRGNKKQSS